MHKKILRILSLALAIMLLFSVLPQRSSANESEAARILSQITTKYREAQRASGRYTFNGWCATMVNWHLYLMGITAEMTGNDGNTEYDYYYKQTFTSGGYRVRPYSAKQYTLKEALNAITENGTVDVYNVLVGFQRTNTAAGRRYGHACFIHAIIDGKIYFSESYNTALAGTYYREGTPIVCTIDEFSGYYANWTTFEGVIYFGLKTYADTCDFLNTNFIGTATGAADIYSEPCLPQVDDRSKPSGQLQAGERVQVVGLMENGEGEYWYELTGAHRGYVSADQIQMLAADYSDITLSSIAAPHNLRKQVGFNLKGAIDAKYNTLYTLRAQVFSLADGAAEQVLSATVVADSHSYTLYNSALSNKLAFRQLPVGDYLYNLAAVIGTYYIENGKLQLHWQTVNLWSSQFKVVTYRGNTFSVTFDANGGSTALDRTEVDKNAALGILPEANRDGMLFAGWYTAAEGGELVSADTVISQNTTLYAHWVPDTEANGWYLVDGAWHYFVSGQPQPGVVQDNGIIYYLNSDGSPVTGWVEHEGSTYYFAKSGAMQMGWTEIGDSTYYFSETGAMQTGWLTVDEERYYLNEDGSLHTGWLNLDGDDYYFEADGTLATDWTTVEGQRCYFDESGELVLVYTLINDTPCVSVYDQEKAEEVMDILPSNTLLQN